MAESAELKQMVMSLRVSELQVLLGYAGRNKHGRKHELLTKALHLLKADCSPAVHMKIKELYRRRFPAKMVSHSELALSGPHHPATAGMVGGGGAALPAGLTQLAYEGHAGHGGAPSPAALLPLSLLGPGKHELTGLSHHLPTSASLHPVHPDVKLQRLPFYDMLDELIKPTSLASDNSQRYQETCFAFALTPQQVQQISSSMDISGTKCDFSVQVQLRFCLSETSCPQEDHFPPNLCVKVNGKPCNLPGYLPPTKNGVEPKRPSRPINITSLVRLSTTVPNTIVVSWTAEIGRSYSMAVYLVRQQSSTVLLQRLRAKGIRNPDHSRALIKEKLTADPDSEIATTSLRVSLLCPLGKMRLMIPCRALTCSHLQCFDATLYIQMNEKKPTWVCPVCDKKAPYEHLIIDGLFVEILNSCMDCDEIQFKEDGNWAPMRSKKEVQEVSSASYNNGLDGSCRTSSVSDQQSSSSSPSHRDGNSGGKKVEVIDLTLDSSDDDDDDDDEAQHTQPPPPPPAPPLRPPSVNRACPSMSPTSPPIINKGVLNLHHQASPVSRTPSMPALDTSYIPPVPPLIQDYRPYYHTPSDLSELNFFSFLQGDSHQHYNMVMAAAAAASASEDHELLLNRFLPYSTSSSSSSAASQLFLDQSGSSPATSLIAQTNGASSSGSNSSLVSSSSLRDAHLTHSSSHSSLHTHPGVVSSRSSAEAAVAAIYGGIPDVISLD
ncbi:E3 SUMO-protein ligase PIAS1-like isoform X2 [Cynoglossus semilaevis]|uniref:E3 SUMO-protein ligase PIAS1-like isoform X2 n=1 Tax=Cynoglossus semilaevis TaxID=244447 RepID=UPI000495AEAC|nr:E3 SUMO-protein ligase PIAS1-like isoform X2 [Cynoglossus semilaevis]